MRNFIIVLLLGLSLACTEEPDCDLGSNDNTIGVKFYNSEDSTELFLKFIQIRERGTDSVFYTSEDSLSTFTLNLNPTEGEVTYVFQNSTSEDTLTMSYTKELRWLSEECGPFFFYDQLDVVGSSFTYDLASTFIDISVNENIKIYR